MNVELVGVDRTLHDVFAQAEGARDKDDITETALGVERERDTAGRKVGANHFHDPNRKRDGEVVESLIDTIVDRALEEEARKAGPVCRDDRIVAAHIEEALVLSGKARVRKIFRRCRATHREARLRPVLLAQRVVSAEDLRAQVRRQRG